MDKKKVFLAAEIVRKMFIEKKLSREEGLMVLATSLAGFCGGNPKYIEITSEAMAKIAVDLSIHAKEMLDNLDEGH